MTRHFVLKRLFSLWKLKQTCQLALGGHLDVVQLSRFVLRITSPYTMDVQRLAYVHLQLCARAYAQCNCGRALYGIAAGRLIKALLRRVCISARGRSSCIHYTADGTEGSISCKVGSFEKSCLKKKENNLLQWKPLPSLLRIPQTDVTAEINECSRSSRAMAFSPHEFVYVGVQH